MISTAVQDQEREVVHIGECRNKGEGWQEMVRLLVRLHEGEEEVKELQFSNKKTRTSIKLPLKSYASKYVCTSLGV